MVKLRPVLFWDGLDWACDEVLRDQRQLDGPQMGKMRRSRGGQDLCREARGQKQIATM